MKTRLSGASKYLRMIALSVAIQPALAQVTVDGRIDGSFQPSVLPAGADILTLVTDTDGGIIATGDFTQMKDRDTSSTYETRYRVAKFSVGGVMTDFAPLLGGTVLNAAVEPDGSVLYMGAFASADGQPRRRAARYLANGTLDPSFIPPTNAATSISALARHGNGYIIASNAGTYRVNLSGAQDTTFNSYLYTVSAVNVLPGPARNFLINGPFIAVAPGETGLSSKFIKRLLPDGKIQTSPKLTHLVDQEVYCVAVQPDGRILVGGKFGGTTPGVGYPSVGLTRLMPNGELDEDFQEAVGTKYMPYNPFFDGAVRSIALQADGRILVAGDFTNFRNPVSGETRITRRGVARLYPNGSLDETFDAKMDSSFGSTPSTYGVSLQGDGRILIHGKFLTFDNGTSRPKAARLTNYSATQELTYDGTKIRWVRGGSSPEARYVTIEHQSVDTDFKWEPVDDGMATREGITSNWEKTPVTPLLAGTLIRASANIPASQFNAGTSIVSSTIGYMMPELSLMRSNPSVPILNNGTTAFPTAGVGSPEDVPFTVRNTGEGEMTPVQVVVSGTNASEFSVLIPPAAPIPAGGSSTMEIRFNPTSPGAKTATVTINTNDPFLPAFTFTVTGTAITAIEHFRLTHFNTTENTGDAADDKDPDGDGLTNFFEFVAGMIPTDRTSAFTCRVDKTGAQPKAIFGPCLSNRVYEVWSSNSLNGDWAPATGTTTALGAQRTFTDNDASGTKRFYRIKITRP
ncbi:choice-of-anchor D domain-containing protein [Luteolibacter sp. SL250]|uniref:choice-of-anchor D domain-containing protein n=1 Tax=Luteolibacter sp. SL250 TaxID=2995170 RepID=UPI00226F25C2|nr:choice-of-anchor D domain-containing protein [Luteolibacter sp. SL250]WAC20247.1 choice-of-anchor D domain-containing protein [Luteolibacter sp. SL250]